MDTLHQQLSNIPLFATQEILELSPLAQQGHCNHNYLLCTPTKQYVLRLFGIEHRDRALEYQIQSLAHTQGIAPEPLHLDTQRGFMISTYLKGEHKEMLDHIELRSLAKALRLLHAITLDAPKVMLEIDTAMLTHFEDDPVLCHNDLNPYNLLWHHNSPTLIDWEYAGKNDRYFDLASVVVEFALDISEYAFFMEMYFQTKTWNRGKLDAYMQVYREVCVGWWDDRS